MAIINVSFIIPVYNRPEEINELLYSFNNLEGNYNFEIVIIEDGSNDSSENIISKYSNDLNISYFKKNNTGPGDSRNFGMKKARGNYFIILDSNCILPKDCLVNFFANINHRYVDCFGGVDDSHHSFTSFQKAVNFTMTSLITTGGIRGGRSRHKSFQARSFNMGISKNTFELTFICAMILRFAKQHFVLCNLKLIEIIQYTGNGDFKYRVIAFSFEVDTHGEQKPS